MRKLIYFTSLLILFSFSYSAIVEKIFDTNYKIVVSYKDRAIINSSSIFEISGNFSLYDKNGNLANITDASLDISFPSGFVILSKNISNQTFDVLASSQNVKPGFYLFNFTLKVSYTYDNSSKIGVIDFNSTIEVNFIIIDILVFPTEECFPLSKDIMCNSSVNYIVVKAKLFPSNISANISIIGTDACEDLNSSEIITHYIPKKAGNCNILVFSSQKLDSYFFNFSSKSVEIIPYISQLFDFNLSYQNVSFQIYEGENVTFSYSISVSLPQQFKINLENISLENVNFEKEFEVEKNVTKNITFFNLKEGNYRINIRFISNYSIEKNISIEIFVEKFINISYYVEEFNRILKVIKEKNLENDKEILEKLDLLNKTLQNIIYYKKSEDEEKFENIKKEIEELINQKEIEKISEKSEIAKTVNVVYILIFILGGISLIVALFLFRKRKSYFNYKRKKFILSKEDIEMWKKIKEKWKKK
jgi:hypothetical protein